MAIFDFDKEVNRKNTGAIKFDWDVKMGKEGLIPLWVADMDFETPDFIIDAIKERASQGVFGYTEPLDDYYEAVIDWFKRNHNWSIDKEAILTAPGVVYALTIAIEAFTKPGDAIIIQEPVYYLFRKMSAHNNRKVVNSELLYKEGQYEMNLDDFEKKIVENNVKMYILCNPHNPGGRVWTKDELIAVGNICKKHNVLVFADEIHCDLTYEGHDYTPFASISEEFANFSVAGTSASKSFNLAGLQLSNTIIHNKELRDKYKKAFDASGYSEPSIFGVVATKAAYTKGDEWLKEAKEYIKGNIDFVKNYIDDNIPGVEMMVPQGTYLVWLDFSKISDNYREIENLIEKKAKLWLDSGLMFGHSGRLWQRINVACPRSIVEKAMNQLAFAVNEYRKNEM